MPQHGENLLTTHFFLFFKLLCCRTNVSLTEQSSTLSWRHRICLDEYLVFIQFQLIDFNITPFTYAHDFLLLLFQIINLAWKHKLFKFASFVSLLINCKLSGGRYITIRGTSCKVLVIDIDFEIEDDDEQRQIVTKIHTSHNWWL